MSEIKRIEKFTLKGKEFSSLKEVKTFTENRLGQYIDDTRQLLTTPLTTKQSVELFNFIVQNHAVLVDILSTTIDRSDDLQYTNVINILDY